MSLGIVDLEFATTHFTVPLDTLAEATGVDPAKYRYGLRQEQFSMPALDEDAVTLGATAAKRLLERHDPQRIRTLIFATESGVDQSKAAGLFVRSLLQLPPNVRVFEMKQACYAGAGALQTALGLVTRTPGEQVLVIMSDVARYAVDTPGEPTQGAGAVAMLVGTEPRIAEVEPTAGVWSEDINDFWRPNDLTTPLVDGKLSLEAYLQALTGAWDDLLRRGELGIADVDRFVHHQPFTKMAVKAHRHFVEHYGVADTAAADEAVALEPSLGYTPRIGNCYTGSLFVALMSLLHADADVSGERVALLSYGSGAIAEVLTAKILPGYREWVDPAAFAAQLDRRVELSFADYRALHAAHERGSVTDFTNPVVTGAPFRFAGVRDGARMYERRS